MKTIDEALDIMIKDNFLDEELFNDLHNRVETFMYAAQDFSNEKHRWRYSFAAYVPENIQEIVRKKCEKIWNKTFKVTMSAYTLLATVEPLPHCDLKDECSHQIIVYIKGNTDLNKGTGFYMNQKLNTHVGFNENRAILWRSNACHSPLNWASDDKSPRYSLIFQLKEIKD